MAVAPEQTTMAMEPHKAPEQQQHREMTGKAVALRDAHKERIEAEAKAYLQSETQKLEAVAAKEQAKADGKKMQQANKAVLAHKNEEKRADDIVHLGEAKAQKVVAKARQDAHKIKADAQLDEARKIAEASMWAEHEKAQIVEATKNQKAELQEKVDELVAVGQLPPHQHSSLIGKIKHKIGH